MNYDHFSMRTVWVRPVFKYMNKTLIQAGLINMRAGQMLKTDCKEIALIIVPADNKQMAFPAPIVDV